MASVAHIVGVPGSGKTTRLLDLMDLCLQADVDDPHRIGFVTFTRAARREASTRAAARFDLSAESLERRGWFRTLHSVAYSCVEADPEGLISDDKDSRAWLAASLPASSGGSGGRSRLDQDWSEWADVGSDTGKALALWDLARNRLETLQQTWERARRAAIRGGIPPESWVMRVVRRYEKTKEADGRYDFTDLLCRFAGYAPKADGTLVRAYPQGWTPQLTAVFGDELQDLSALQNEVFRRFCSHARWIYCVGDPLQAIFGFQGSDPKHFLGWGQLASRRQVLNKTWRCPRRHIELAERLVRGNREWFDRNIEHSGAEGEVDRCRVEDLAGSVDLGAQTLVVCRTNRAARTVGELLSAVRVPWSPIRGRGGVNAPRRAKAVAALLSVAAGDPVDGDDWHSLLDEVPAKVGGEQMFVRGTKRRFEDKDERKRHEFAVGAPALRELGATDAFLSAVAAGRWAALAPRSYVLLETARRHGSGALYRPPVLVGTVHSAKGMEADDVFALTTSTKACIESEDSVEGREEERRVWYVAATRARRRLTVVDDFSERNRFGGIDF